MFLLFLVVVAHKKHWPLSSLANERLAQIRSPGRLSWNDLSADRIRHVIPRVNAGEFRLLFLVISTNLFCVDISALIFVISFVQLVGK